MFRLNSDDFFGFGNHRNRPRVGKVENWALMTPFCTRNIPTMFRVQFLWFPVSTAEKYFDRMLMTFPGLESSRARKVENRAEMTWFCTRNIALVFGEYFLLFHISTTEKCFN